MCALEKLILLFSCFCFVFVFNKERCIYQEPVLSFFRPDVMLRLVFVQMTLVDVSSRRADVLEEALLQRSEKPVPSKCHVISNRMVFDEVRETGPLFHFPEALDGIVVVVVVALVHVFVLVVDDVVVAVAVAVPVSARAPNKDSLMLTEKHGNSGRHWLSSSPGDHSSSTTLGSCRGPHVGLLFPVHISCNTF